MTTPGDGLELSPNVEWARRVQFGIWASWSADQRLRAVGQMTELILALRDDRLRRQHPDASADEFRRLRIADTLLHSPTLRLP